MQDKISFFEASIKQGGLGVVTGLEEYFKRHSELATSERRRARVGPTYGRACSFTAQTGVAAVGPGPAVGGPGPRASGTHSTRYS